MNQETKPGLGEPQAVSVPSSLSLTVILPTYNERENIPILIAGILACVRTPVQVLVVDDNSPDGTWQVVEDIAAREPRVRLLLRTTERGLTSAIWAGTQAADTDAVSWMDCDLAMPPELIPLQLDRLNAGADIAIGSRYVPRRQRFRSRPDGTRFLDHYQHLRLVPFGLGGARLYQRFRGCPT